MVQFAKIIIDKTILIEVTVKMDPINCYFQTSKFFNKTGNRWIMDLTRDVVILH